jgi:hypothetical protein
MGAVLLHFDSIVLGFFEPAQGALEEVSPEANDHLMSGEIDRSCTGDADEQVGFLGVVEEPDELLVFCLLRSNERREFAGANEWAW